MGRIPATKCPWASPPLYSLGDYLENGQDANKCPRGHLTPFIIQFEEIG